MARRNLCWRGLTERTWLDLAQRRTAMIFVTDVPNFKYTRNMTIYLRLSTLKLED